VPTSFGTGGRPYSTDSRTGLQRRGRLARPRRLTTPRTTLPSALAAGSRVRTGLQRGGQLARPHWFTMPRPTHLSTSVADSLVIGFNFTIVIINSSADNFWLNISGEIQLLWLASFPMQDKLSTAKRDYYITKLLDNSCRFISRLNMKNLKPTPRVVLRLGGYNDMTWELRVIGGKDNPVPEATAILMKI
jgi:hypothetical protein